MTEHYVKVRCSCGREYIGQITGNNLPVCPNRSDPSYLHSPVDYANVAKPVECPHDQVTFQWDEIEWCADCGAIRASVAQNIPTDVWIRPKYWELIG